jgi:hypothetical protein
MAKRLAEGTDLIHVTNPAQTNLYFCFLTETLLKLTSKSFLHEHIS